MLIVPGDGPVIYEKNASVFIFDTVNWETKTTFDPFNKELLVPTVIVDLVGGTTKGGATLQTPYGNGTFDDAALTEIFKLSIPKSRKKSKKHNKSEIIASAVLGSFVVTFGVVVGIIFYYQRRKDGSKGC